MYLFITLSVLDILTTVVGVFGMGLRESNPIARKIMTDLSWPGMLAFKTLGVVIVILGAKTLSSGMRKKAYTTVNTIMIFVCVINMLSIHLATTGA